VCGYLLNTRHAHRCSTASRQLAGRAFEKQFLLIIISMSMRLFAIFAAAVFSGAVASGATAYYVDAVSGNDGNGGHSPAEAWKSLEKASGATLAGGDRLLLKRGAVFPGHLVIKARGFEGRPVVVDSYGEGTPPKIDAAGYLAGVHVLASSFLEINNLEITSDAGELKEPSAKKKRYGVYVTAFVDGTFRNVTLRDLHIHDIFASDQVELGGKNQTSNPGIGIEISPQSTAVFRDMLIEHCRIERTGFTGISLHGHKKSGEGFALRDVRVINNTLKDIGGPGMQPGTMHGLVVRGNTVDNSGSGADKRMHARGSGIWPWSCDDVLIENNRFMHARGKADSCGMHIDYNCKNVVAQYNLSLDNEGGFVEILGNNFNCAYRYNISINDGFRVKGMGGAHQEGKTLWLTGYVGKAEKTGPVNSYIYNNTIYVRADVRSCFSIGRTTDGILIANNIFHVLGRTENVYGDQDDRKEPAGAKIRNVVFKNNLYCRANMLPDSLPIRDTGVIVGDAKFAQPGGFDPADYIPAAKALVQNRGIFIEKLPGDAIGLKIGLAVAADFFGKPIIGLPDLGAVEVP
jgi:hypothetical protein